MLVVVCSSINKSKVWARTVTLTGAECGGKKEFASLRTRQAISDLRMSTVERQNTGYAITPVKLLKVRSEEASMSFASTPRVAHFITNSRQLHRQSCHFIASTTISSVIWIASTRWRRTTRQCC
jgi:hypothetical protein